MKSSSHTLPAFSRTLLTASIFGATLSHAADIYWDGILNGSWNTVTNWSDSADGTADPGAVPGSADVALFNITGQNTNETVNLDGPQSALGLSFSSSGTVTINSGIPTTSDLTLGGSGIAVNSGAGAVTINAPLVLSSNQTYNAAPGTSLKLSGGVTSSASRELSINGTAGNTGSVTINSDLWLSTDSSAMTRRFFPKAGTTYLTSCSAYLTRFVVGGSGATPTPAALVMTNAAVTSDGAVDNGDLNLGNSSKSTLDMHGGSLTTKWGGIYMGLGSGSGHLTIDNGAIIKLDTTGSPGNYSEWPMGDGGSNANAGKDNQVTMRSGSVSIAPNGAMRLGVATGSTNVFNQLGGTVSLPKNTGVTPFNGNPAAGLNFQYRMNREQLYGIYNLNGGTLTVGSIMNGDGATGVDSNNAYFNFHGGTLSPSVAEPNFVRTSITGVNAARGAARLFTYSEGAIIDTNGISIGIQGPVLAPQGNGVYASGAGALTIPTVSAGSGYRTTPMILITDPAGTSVSSGTAASGSPVLTAFSSTANISPGARIYGTNIPVGARVLSTTATTVTMDLNASGNGSTGTTTVKGQAATAVANMADDGTGNGTLKIVSITITNPGVGYPAGLTVSVAGGRLSQSNSVTPTVAAVLPDLTTAPNVSGGLTKRGDGVLTLGGINTYTGDTVVEGGAIDLADNAGIKFVVTNSSNNKITGSAPGQIFLKGDFTIDLSAVSVGTGTWNLVDVAAAGAVFDSATFTVIGFTDPEQDGIWTLVDGPNTWTFTQADGNLRLNPVALTPYEEWINGYSGTIILSQRDPGDDPDGDGASNLLEFAFKGRPDDSSSTGLFYAEQKDNADVGTAKELTFTCAMRAAPTVGFTANGNGAQHADALISGLDYIIEADVDMLGTWSSDVSYIGASPTPPAGSGLEDLTGDQWEYRTFSAFDGLPGKGFIRGRVSMP